MQRLSTGALPDGTVNNTMFCGAALSGRVRSYITRALSRNNTSSTVTVTTVSFTLTTKLCVLQPGSSSSHLNYYIWRNVKEKSQVDSFLRFLFNAIYLQTFLYGIFTFFLFIFLTPLLVFFGFLHLVWPLPHGTLSRTFASLRFQGWVLSTHRSCTEVYCAIAFCFEWFLLQQFYQMIRTELVILMIWADFSAISAKALGRPL